MVEVNFVTETLEIQRKKKKNWKFKVWCERSGTLWFIMQLTLCGRPNKIQSINVDDHKNLRSSSIDRPGLPLID